MNGGIKKHLAERHTAYYLGIDKRREVGAAHIGGSEIESCKGCKAGKRRVGTRTYLRHHSGAYRVSALHGNRSYQTKDNEYGGNDDNGLTASPETANQSHYVYTTLFLFNRGVVVLVFVHSAS